MSELAAQPLPNAGFSLRGIITGARSESDPLTRVMGFLLVAVQFAIILFLVQRFRLEDDRFLLIVRAAFGGFLVHHFLPARWRTPFFLVLSLGTVAYFFGLHQGQWQAQRALERTGLLVGIGLVFIGICHLPLGYWKRAALLVVAAVGLALFRAGWISVAPLNAIWPIFAAMFIFRLIIYLYDREHEKEHASFSQVLSYFFLFPCLWIFVFPIIDYKNFRRGYYNDRPVAIYQKGLGWMMRGVVHLLLWRLVYYHLYLDPSRISSGAELVQFMVANVALYLRVSGQFHFTIGLLHLFGFNLPEVNRRYFLASSFTDYWRRVAIYWKDFMLKVFYYPAVVRLKAWGPTWSVVGAIAFSFTLTWLLHSYQWFWLRGDFPIAPKDMLFWGLLGALVIASSLRELKRGRQRSLKQQAYRWKDSLGLALRTAATFTVITLLWSIWSSDSVAQWAAIWKFADREALLYGAAVLACLGIAGAVLESPSSPWKSREPSAADIPAVPWRLAAANTCVAVVLVAGTSGVVTERFSYHTEQVLASLFKNTPNKADEEYIVRGYYENLTDASRFKTIDSAIASKPSDWLSLEDTPALRDTYDLRTKELVPSVHLVLNGKRVQINSAGLRDREYALIKPPGTFRIALLGSSIVMGSGVSNDEIFEALVEERLNREHRGAPWERYEILNFAVNAYSPVSLVELLKRKILAYSPDAVIFVSHRQDPSRSASMLAKSIRMGVQVHEPNLQQVLARAGVGGSTRREEAEDRLAPYGHELARWAYQEIANQCREHRIVPVWIYLPGLWQQGKTARSVDDDRIIAAAKEAGFHTLTLFGIFDNRDVTPLMVAPWDGHPNAEGHQIIADSLYEVLTTTEGLGLGIAEHARSGKGEPKQ